MNSYILFGIFMCLLDGKVHKATTLAENFEVSTKTIYRNIDRLISAGFPITTLSGKNGGVSLANKFRCDTWFFTEKELGYMLNMLSLNSPIDPTTGEILYCKLREHISSKKLIDASKFAGKFFVDTSGWFSTSTENDNSYHLILSACEQERQLEIVYDGNSQPRIVDPCCVIYKESNYYLYAYCNTRCDYRMFKINKVKSAKMLDEKCKTFAKNLVDRPWNKNINFEKVDVVIRCDNQTAADISCWANIAKLDEEKYKIKATLNHGLIHKLMECGDKLEVLEPLKIRIAIADECRKILKMYS